tara:strand:+ start:5032 stop:6711 length:1680 start_codon:yes stop_codon:yes gene_type:complete
MSSLPTAHASQRFGRRQIEFFAVSGHVAGTEGRMRANERRIQDLDGGNHAIRMADRNARLEPGDSVAVLRLQAGPERGSRPVSAVNYAQNTWVELGKGASASLARTGISRGGIWWFAMLAFMLTALAIVWSELRIFLIEVNGDIFGATPEFALFPWLQAQLPFLVGFDLSAQIPSLPETLASTGLVSLEQTNLLVTSLVLVALGLVAYGARTWRIVWIPVFIAALLAAGLMIAGTGAGNFALLALGITALFFVLAGLVNRIRDASRLRGRIARLSEHLLRHPPVESVTTPAPPRAEPVMANQASQAAAGAASAAAMAAVAAAVTENESTDDETVAQGESDTTPVEDVPSEALEETRMDGSDVTEVDDLPSDAELEAARATLAADSAELAPLSNRSTTDAVTLDAVEEQNDRDMILPPPPPMAGPSDAAATGETGETETGADAPSLPDAAEAADAVDAAPLVAPEVAETVATQLRAVPVSDAGEDTITARDAGVDTPAEATQPSSERTASEPSDSEDDRSEDTADLSGDDPMMSADADGDAGVSADSDDDSEERDPPTPG